MSNSDISPTLEPTQSPKPQSSKPATRHGWRRAARIVLVLVLLLVAVQLVASRLARGWIADAHAHVEARGESLRFTNFLPAKIEPANNASPYMEATAALLEAWDDENVQLRADLAKLLRDLERRGAQPTVEDLELFRRAVENSTLELEILDAARARTDAYLDADYSVVPYEIEVPNLLARLWMGDLLSARARLAAAEGRGSDAWHDVTTIFRLSRWTAREMSTLIHGLIAIALTRRVAMEAEGIAAVVAPKDTELTAVLAEAHAWDIAERMDFLIQVERSSIFTTLRSAIKEQHGAPSLFESTWGRFVWQPIYSPYVDWNAAVYAKAMSPLIDDCRLPTRARPVKHGDDEAFAERYTPSSAAQIARSVYFSLYLDVCTKRDGVLAHLDLMEIGLRWAEHRARTGAAPTGLAEIGMDGAIDPFSGSPYRLGDGVVYSFAANLRDDGGTAPPTKVSASPALYEADLIWRLSRAE